MLPAVTGLDLSLAASGIASVSLTEAGWLLRTELAKSTALPVTATVADWAVRIETLGDRIVAATPPGLAVIESPSHNSRFGKPHERGGLWWHVAIGLRRRGDVALAQITPATRAIYAANSGKASKQEVVAALAASIPSSGVTNHNIADALALAALGCRRLGRPLEAQDITTKQLTAYRKVRWPHLEGITDDHDTD